MDRLTGGAYREPDKLRLYFGDDYEASDGIVIHQPTIEEIADYGEVAYFGLVDLLTAIPSDIKSVLWDGGIDWTKMPDIDLFFMMASRVPPEQSAVLFGELDLRRFTLREDEQGHSLLQNPEGVRIDEQVHARILRALCMMHHLTKKPEKAFNKLTKHVLIEEDRANRARPPGKEKLRLFPLASALANSPGCKYGPNDIRHMKVFPFFDSVARAQLLFHLTGLQVGYYTGNLDTKTFSPKKLDYFRDLD